MENSLRKRDDVRRKRALRIRKHLRGTAQKPRLSVQRSNRHISAQIIDDEKGVTLASFGTLSKDSKFKVKSRESAAHVGEQIATLAKGKNIEAVIFDRGRNKYHGVIASLADAARKTGLKF